MPVESRKPLSFDQPPRHRSHPPADRFSVSQAYFKGEEQKKHAKEIIDSHHSKKDQLLIYCRSMGPNLMQTLPTWTVVCIAYKCDQEIDRRITVVGQNASSREAGFCTVADTTALAKDLLGIFPSSSVMIFTADHFVLPYCQITDRHDNARACRAICDSTAAILDTHINTTLSLGWLPGKTLFHPLEHLQELTIEAAALTPPRPRPVKSLTRSPLRAGQE